MDAKVNNNIKKRVLEKLNNFFTSEDEINGFLTILEFTNSAYFHFIEKVLGDKSMLDNELIIDLLCVKTSCDYRRMYFYVSNGKVNINAKLNFIPPASIMNLNMITKTNFISQLLKQNISDDFIIHQNEFLSVLKERTILEKEEIDKFNNNSPSIKELEGLFERIERVFYDYFSTLLQSFSDLNVKGVDIENEKKVSLKYTLNYLLPKIII